MSLLDILDPLDLVHSSDDSGADTSSSGSGGDFGGASSASDHPTAGVSHNLNWTPSTPADPISYGGNMPAGKQAPNSAFTAGLNLLFQDPGAFLNLATGGDASSVPDAEINRAATTPLKNNLPNLPTIPTWVKLVAIGGLLVAGLGVGAYILHEVKP